MLIGIGGTALTKPGGKPATFDPKSITGLFVWLKADDGVTADGSNAVSAWTDQSGSGNNFTQTTAANKPTLTANAQNGKPSVVFDGTSDYMLTGSITFGAWSMFAVLSKNWTTATYSGVWRHGFSSNFGRGFFTSGGAFQDWQAKDFIGVGNGYFSSYVPRVGGSYGAIADGTYHVVSAGCGASTFLRLDKTSIAQYGTAASPTTGTEVFAIGTFNSVYASDFWNGGIAELLMYNSVLSASDTSRVEDYLKAKWATP